MRNSAVTKKRQGEDLLSELLPSVDRSAADDPGGVVSDGVGSLESSPEFVASSDRFSRDCFPKILPFF